MNEWRNEWINEWMNELKLLVGQTTISNFLKSDLPEIIWDKVTLVRISPFWRLPLSVRDTADKVETTVLNS